MELCKFQRCAVCPDIKYRNVFRYALKERNPEVKICSEASYKITNYNGDSFIITNLEHIREGTKGFYVIDLYTAMPIYLSNKNFEILCNCTAECKATEYVAIYSNGKSL